MKKNVLAGPIVGTKQRFVTLDVFRGMTVFLMIVVNTQGSGAIPYAAMMHAGWNGCTLTDLVFPSFVFAVGNAMAFTRPGMGKIFRRSILLFVVGWLLTWYLSGASLGEVRVLAVLQRIALAYLIAALVVKALDGPAGQGRGGDDALRAGRKLSDRWVLMVSVALLLVYWLLLELLGVHGQAYTVEGNAVRRIDLLILGPQHMYREKGIAFDPEGLLSTLPAVVNVLAGYLAGRWVVRKGASFETVAGLLVTGTLLVGLGLVWNGWMPLNKKLWTSSYVVYTSGIDLLALGVLFYLIEVLDWKRGTAFFSIFGKNPLFIYILSTLMGIFLVIRVRGDEVLIDWVNRVLFQRVAPGPVGALLFALAYTFICWCVGWILDKKKIYIRL